MTLFKDNDRLTSFVVQGAPVGKGRPRITTRSGFARAFTPERTRNYESQVAEAARLAMAKDGQATISGPVSVFIKANFAIPASYTKKKRALCAQGAIRPTVKPDIDNIVKAILDGMNGVVYEDDKQVVACTITKHYTTSEQGFVYIEVSVAT